MHPPEERNILVRSQGSAHARGARAVEHRSYTPRDRVRLPACAHGAVAQSGEHLVCTQAVVGSMPTGSTCFRSSAEESAWLRTRRSGVRVPPGTLRRLCSSSSRDRSGGRSPGSYPGGRRFESDSRNFARVVEPPGRHTGSRGQRASRPMRVRPSPRAPHSRPGGGTTGRHTSLRSWRSRRACEFDSRPGHCDVQVAETVDTPRSKRGALAGVRVRLPPWTTMEGEPARRRRRLEPGGHRQVWGSRPPPSASPRARRRSSARASGR